MTESSQWMSIKEAATVTDRHRMTIWRWVNAGYVRQMKAGRRVLVRRLDVTLTERAVFDGQKPLVRGP